MLYCILESLQQLNKDNQNMAISFGAAIDLLLAYEDSAASESVEADESEEAFNVNFTCSYNYLFKTNFIIS